MARRPPRAGQPAAAFSSRSAIKLGRLIPIHRGVYAVGHEALSDCGRAIAALLAAGPGAVASHRTAAYLWNLIPALPGVIDVTTHRRARRSRPGLAIHESKRPPASTRRRAGLPEPQVNHPVGPYRIDFAWLEQRVLVATDGYAVHGHRTAFENDRARDADLHAQGYVVLRFTWRQITDEPLKVAARLAQTLARAGQPEAAFSNLSASRLIPSSAAAAAPPA